MVKHLGDIKKLNGYKLPPVDVVIGGSLVSQDLSGCGQGVQALEKGAGNVSIPAKPENPYRKGSIIWSVMEGEWEDLTPTQIAEVLDTTKNAVCSAISKIKRETGWSVPHAIKQTSR